MSQPTQSDVDAIASTYWDSLKIIEGAISSHFHGVTQSQQIAASIISQLSHAGLNIFSEQEIDRIRQEAQPSVPVSRIRRILAGWRLSGPITKLLTEECVAERNALIDDIEKRLTEGAAP